jgi:hypothetical protein
MTTTDVSGDSITWLNAPSSKERPTNCRPSCLVGVCVTRSVWRIGQEPDKCAKRVSKQPLPSHNNSFPAYAVAATAAAALDVRRGSPVPNPFDAAVAMDHHFVPDIRRRRSFRRR